MARIGRNDPCPCGSGKKYKKCCLEADSRRAHRPASVTALGKALDWVDRNYGAEFVQAGSCQFAAGRGQDFWDEIAELPESLRRTFEINLIEWCLVEGRVDPGRRPRRFIELAAQNLSDGEREYLERLSRAQLDLYEVVDVLPGECVWLVPTLRPDRPRFLVQEKTASQLLTVGTILGCRVVDADPPFLSGALYPFNRPQYLAIRGRLAERLEKGQPLPAGLVGRCIVDAWLDALTAPPPEIVDSASGDPLLLTTLHYQVRDWSRLESVLAEQSDVVREDEDSWIRLQTGDAQKRPLCALHREAGKRLEVFARTAAYADQAGQWLDRIAGEIVRPVDRTTLDPRELWKDRFADKGRRPPSENPLASLSRDERSRFWQLQMERTYADWADRPLPMLGGKTPRQAVGFAALRREVAELIRSYEIGDRQRAGEDDRAPVDYGFLWDAVGLSREEFER